MPEIAITREDSVSFCPELFSCCKEFVPAWSNLRSDHCRIIGSPHILGNRATIDQRTTGCLIPKTDELTIGVCPDINGVLCDIRFFQLCIYIDTQTLVRCCK